MNEYDIAKDWYLEFILCGEPLVMYIIESLSCHLKHNIIYKLYFNFEKLEKI